RNPERDRTGVQRCLSDAAAADRSFRSAADQVARRHDPAKEAPRHRSHGRRDRQGNDVSDLPRRAAAEFLGSAFLLAAVVGSGIMAAKLSGGNGALALLCNTLPTGAILTVLILTLGPISGAHFNPAVSLAAALRGEMTANSTVIYIGAQVVG